MKLSRVDRLIFFDLFSKKVYHTPTIKIVMIVVVAITTISRALTEEKFKNVYVRAFEMRLKPFRKPVEPFRVMDRQEAYKQIFAR